MIPSASNLPFNSLPQFSFYLRFCNLYFFLDCLIPFVEHKDHKVDSLFDCFARSSLADSSSILIILLISFRLCVTLRPENLAASVS